MSGTLAPNEDPGEVDEHDDAPYNGGEDVEAAIGHIVVEGVRDVRAVVSPRSACCDDRAIPVQVEGWGCDGRHGG